jgi:hypothetical protein
MAWIRPLKSSRIANVGIAWIGLVVPFFAAYGSMALMVNRRPGKPNSGPNPNAASLSKWTPGELLVFVDPWFAGVLVYWLAFCIAAAALFVAAVFLKWPIGPTGRPKRRHLLAIALLIGTVFAGPWAYGLIFLLFRRA